ncbi:hypothetical protein CSW59_19055 [Caulobacter sp. BP25]|nr:hypothetical protein [Caulobacter sp. BP25]PHY17142.1 hypothetical protein CSW59_19055 [Caulobacter sp. BP25]
MIGRLATRYERHPNRADVEDFVNKHKSAMGQDIDEILGVLRQERLGDWLCRRALSEGAALTKTRV